MVISLIDTPVLPRARLPVYSNISKTTWRYAMRPGAGQVAETRAGSSEVFSSHFANGFGTRQHGKRMVLVE